VFHVCELLLSDADAAVALAPEPLFQSRRARGVLKRGPEMLWIVTATCAPAVKEQLQPAEHQGTRLCMAEFPETRSTAGSCGCLQGDALPVCGPGRAGVTGKLGAHLAHGEGGVCSVFVYSGLFSHLIFKYLQVALQSVSASCVKVTLGWQWRALFA